MLATMLHEFLTANRAAIRVRDLAGAGRVFTGELPMAPAALNLSDRAR